MQQTEEPPGFGSRPMTAEESYKVVLHGLREHCGASEALITPDARLAEDLGLTWEAVDSLFADMAEWSPFDWLPRDLDYWSIYRGLDRHFLGPYRERDARARKRFLRKWSILPGSHALPLEPLTVRDTARFVYARRYVRCEPLAGLEETVVRRVHDISKARRDSITRDSRLREDLGFDWRRFHRLLVAIDDDLDGGFCSSLKARLFHEAFLYWEAMEHIAGTPPATVGDLMETVRENRWTGSAKVDWQASIPGKTEEATLSEEQIVYAIKWILVGRRLSGDRCL